MMKQGEKMMNEAIQTLIENIKNDYREWTFRCAKGDLSEINKKMIAEFEEKVCYKEGNKYIRIFQDNSVWGFIVNVDNDKKFNYGDILMAAGYNSPARNKARGNIFEQERLRVQWTGANYL